MKKWKKLLLAGTMTLLCGSLLTGFRSAGEYAAGKGKLRAATYFGEAWPINFWSAEHSGAPEDFARIKADGFDQIILCVPWKEFQPYLYSTRTDSSFNSYALSALDELCEAAEEAGLGVILRLGYTWDFYGSENVMERYRGLIYQEDVREAWKRYAAEIYSIVSEHENFTGAFLTWEDFWNFPEQVQTMSRTDARRYAREMGFSDAVSERYGRETLVGLYGSETDASYAAFPKPDSPAYALFLEWYDEFLNELLAETQEVFPDLSMECRLDVDAYRAADGTALGYAHEKTFSCADASYASAMLSVSMGHQDGMKIPVSAAVASSRAQIERINAVSGKPLFVDQFLYMETTPGYENIAALNEGDVNEYLEQMGTVFRDSTMGYGLWTYRDYSDSVIYNPGFALNFEGWTKSGKAAAAEKNGRMTAALGKGASISQDISRRNFMSSRAVKVEIRGSAEQETTLTVKLGDDSKTVKISGEDETVKLEFPAKRYGKVTITAGDTVWIDEVNVYSHVTEGGVYLLDGSEGPYLSGVRACNAALK